METTMIKLDMNLDRMAKGREEAKNAEVGYVVTFFYIAIGKKIIEKTRNTDLSKTLVSKNIVSEAEKQFYRAEAMKNPLKYYQTYTVCYQCYHIYSYLMKEYSLAPSKLISFKSLKPKPVKSYMQSELGPLNKNNLNDLLLDMSFYLASCDMDCDEKVKKIFSDQTELNKSIAEDSEIAKTALLRKSFRESAKSGSLDLMPSMTPTVKKIRRRSKRILSKIGQFYIGKPKRLGSRLIIK